mmetsp:Transcript_21055/g.62685  ORF Transcript_21055/g.62685 Transcript_21055/m.62685 type:complete len:271 (-) Transcript_21055:111-923(-)
MGLIWAAFTSACVGYAAMVPPRLKHGMFGSVASFCTAAFHAAKAVAFVTRRLTSHPHPKCSMEYCVSGVLETTSKTRGSVMGGTKVSTTMFRRPSSFSPRRRSSITDWFASRYARTPRTSGSASISSRREAYAETGPTPNPGGGCARMAPTLGPSVAGSVRSATACTHLASLSQSSGLAETSQNTKWDTGANGAEVAAYSGTLMLHAHGGRHGQAPGGVGLVQVYSIPLVVVIRWTWVSTISKGSSGADGGSIAVAIASTSTDIVAQNDA